MQLVTLEKLLESLGGTVGPGKFRVQNNMEFGGSGENPIILQRHEKLQDGFERFVGVNILSDMLYLDKIVKPELIDDGIFIYSSRDPHVFFTSVLLRDNSDYVILTTLLCRAGIKFESIVTETEETYYFLPSWEGERETKSIYLLDTKTGELSLVAVHASMPPRGAPRNPYESKPPVNKKIVTRVLNPKYAVEITQLASGVEVNYRAGKYPMLEDMSELKKYPPTKF